MTGDLPSGTHRVCPRCGAAATGEAFCASCGLNLSRQGELPTADAYSAGVREQRWLEEQERDREAQAERARAARQAEDQRRLEDKRRTDDEATRAAASRPSEPRRRRRAVLTAVLVVAVLGGAAAGAALLTGGSDTGTPESGEAVFFTDDDANARQRPARLLFGKTIISDLVWTRWGSDPAEATGTIGQLSCDPSCAEGDYTYSDVTVTLSAIRECEGRRQYTRGRLRVEDPDGEVFDDEITSSEVSCAQAGRAP